MHKVIWGVIGTCLTAVIGFRLWMLGFFDAVKRRHDTKKMFKKYYQIHGKKQGSFHEKYRG